MLRRSNTSLFLKLLPMPENAPVYRSISRIEGLLRLKITRTKFGLYVYHARSEDEMNWDGLGLGLRGDCMILGSPGGPRCWKSSPN